MVIINNDDFLNLFSHPRNPRGDSDRDKHSDNFKNLRRYHILHLAFPYRRIANRFFGRKVSCKCRVTTKSGTSCPKFLDENGYHKALWWEIHEKEVSEQIQLSDTKNANSGLVCLNRHGFILVANRSNIRVMLPRDMEGIVPGTKETVSQGEAKKKISFWSCVCWYRSLQQ